MFADGALLSPVASTHCFSLFFVVSSGGESADGAPLSPFASACCFLSFSIASANGAGGASTSAGDTSAGITPLFPVAGVSLLSAMPSVSSQALFLSSTPSCARCFSLLFSPFFHFSLPSSPLPLARNSTPFTGKRLFDQAFITQKPIASIQKYKKLDLRFGQCSYSVSAKINGL